MKSHKDDPKNAFALPKSGNGLGIKAGSTRRGKVEFKMFWWKDEIRRGDCVMEPLSRIVLYKDGFGRFLATTYTRHTHSGDVWHHLMYVTDSRGEFLFWVGFFDGPVMDDGNPPPRYSWQKDFRFDPKHWK